MKFIKTRLAAMSLLAIGTTYTYASSWQLDAIQSQQQASFKADITDIRARLGMQQAQAKIELPFPNGDVQTFVVSENRTMSAELKKKFPLLRSYSGHQLGSPSTKVTLTLNEDGLHGFVLAEKQSFTISPDTQAQGYISQNTVVSKLNAAGWKDRVIDAGLSAQQSAPQVLESTGDKNRVFRLAVATSGEYTAFHGGTVNAGLAAVVTAVDRVNLVLQRDLSTTLELVGDNDELIFTDADTDPYDFDKDGGDTLEDNQAAIDARIGNANYDIGHLLSTDPGGLAVLGSLCSTSFKAEGMSGASAPVNDGFTIDILAHELGHQLGARHTFNSEVGSCLDNRTASTAYEPGSGSTIMAYAGLCGIDNVQTTSDDYFHAMSLAEMQSQLELVDGVCGVSTDTSNQAPVATAPADMSIPSATPFYLQGSATDADSSDLLHTYEQIDLGAASFGTADHVDDGTRPLFRSVAPSSSSLRYLPELSSLRGRLQAPGEVYATTDRTLNFRYTVRDGDGASASDDVSMTVIASAGPFEITEPAFREVITGNTQQQLSWDVAGTASAPINCNSLSLSLWNAQDEKVADIASDIANDGSASFLVPNNDMDQAYLMLSCNNNVFFAFSRQLTIQQGQSTTIAPAITASDVLSVAEDQAIEITLANLTVNDPDSSFPADFSLIVENGDNYSVAGTSVQPDANFSGQLSVNVRVNDGENDSPSAAVTVNVSPVNDAPEANNDSFNVNMDSSNNTLNVLANDIDVDEGDSLTLVSATSSANASVSISNNSINYTPAAGFSGQDNVSYQITDDAGLTAEAIARITVVDNSTTAPTTSGGSSGGGGSSLWLTLLATLFALKRHRN